MIKGCARHKSDSRPKWRNQQVESKSDGVIRWQNLMMEMIRAARQDTFAPDDVTRLASSGTIYNR